MLNKNLENNQETDRISIKDDLVPKGDLVRKIEVA